MSFLRDSLGRTQCHTHTTAPHSHERFARLPRHRRDEVHNIHFARIIILPDREDTEADSLALRCALRAISGSQGVPPRQPATCHLPTTNASPRLASYAVGPHRTLLSRSDVIRGRCRSDSMQQFPLRASKCAAIEKLAVCRSRIDYSPRSPFPESWPLHQAVLNAPEMQTKLSSSPSRTTRPSGPP